MRILTTTQVFPSSAHPLHGVFVRERMARVARMHEVKAVVPMPYFPGSELLRPGYRPRAAPHGWQAGIETWYPRYFNIPRYLKVMDGFWYALSALATVRRVRRTFDFDVIDAHFAYPDGVGAALLALWFRKPFVITLRGTIGKYSRLGWGRHQLAWALGRATRIISVCGYLKEKAVCLGIPESKIHVIPNGVDVGRFYPVDRAEARRELGLPPDAKVIVSVGHIVERKGFHHVISVLPRILERHPGVMLVIVGGPGVEGDYTDVLERLIRSLALDGRVVMAGRQEPERIRLYLNSADVFCLATHGEGWANVLMEAMACGVPVVTTRVGGNAEVVSSDEVGVLVDPGDRGQLGRALDLALTRRWDRGRIVARVASQTWEHVAARVAEVLEEAAADRCAGGRER